MISLKLKGGTKIEAKDGWISVDGSCVTLYDVVRSENVLLIGYCLIPGETVRRVKEGEYEIEF